MSGGPRPAPVTPARAGAAPHPMTRTPQPRQRPADDLPRCLAHSLYYLASCDGCRAAQSARIDRIRAALVPA